MRWCVSNDAIPRDVNGGAAINVDGIAAAPAARTSAAGASAVVRAPDDMENVTDAAISGDDATTVFDTTRVLSGAKLHCQRCGNRRCAVRVGEGKG